MKLTPEQESQIRQLSDAEMYPEAVDFASQYPPVQKSQMAGLLEFSRSWEELAGFVRHQKDDRDWGEPGKSKRAHYKDFYTALDAHLNELRRRSREQYNFVPDGLTKNENRQQTDFFAGLLAREFIQHLVAEMMWKEEKGS